jgi:hypothetical protein
MGKDAKQTYDEMIRYFVLNKAAIKKAETAAIGEKDDHFSDLAKKKIQAIIDKLEQVPQ